MVMALILIKKLYKCYQLFMIYHLTLIRHVYVKRRTIGLHAEHMISFYIYVLATILNIIRPLSCVWYLLFYTLILV